MLTPEGNVRMTDEHTANLLEPSMWCRGRLKLFVTASYKAADRHGDWQ